MLAVVASILAAANDVCDATSSVRASEALVWAIAVPAQIVAGALWAVATFFWDVAT